MEAVPIDDIADRVSTLGCAVSSKTEDHRTTMTVMLPVDS